MKIMRFKFIQQTVSFLLKRTAFKLEWTGTIMYLLKAQFHKSFKKRSDLVKHVNETKNLQVISTQIFVTKGGLFSECFALSLKCRY